MSRHRNVRNLDLDEELDDGMFEDEVTPDQQRQLDTLAPQVASILGPADPSEPEGEINEKDIRDALWNSWFDVQQSVDYLLKERQKRITQARKKREKVAAGVSDGDDVDTDAMLLDCQPPPEQQPSASTTSRPSSSNRFAQSTHASQPPAASVPAKRTLASLARLSNPPAAPPSSSGHTPRLGLAALAKSSRTSADDANKSPKIGLAGLAAIRSRQGQSPSSTEPPARSSLASLARRNTPVNAPPVFSSSSSPPSSTSIAAAPKLSRLQQRIAEMALGGGSTASASVTATGKAKEKTEDGPYMLPSSPLFGTHDANGDLDILDDASTTPSSSTFVSLQTLSPSASVGAERRKLINAIEDSFGPFGSSYSLSTASADRQTRIADVDKAFAGPSPDDVVLTARRGTALGRAGG